MTMLELSRNQRLLLADKLSDAANVAAGAMVFGRFLSDRPFSVWQTVMGGALWIVFVMCGVVLAERKRS